MRLFPRPSIHLWGKIINVVVVISVSTTSWDTRWDTSGARLKQPGRGYHWVLKDNEVQESPSRPSSEISQSDIQPFVHPLRYLHWQKKTRNAGYILPWIFINRIIKKVLHYFLLSILEEKAVHHALHKFFLLLYVFGRSHRIWGVDYNQVIIG